MRKAYQEGLCLATVAPRLPYSRKTVYHYFRSRRLDGTWERIHVALPNRPTVAGIKHVGERSEQAVVSRAAGDGRSRRLRSRL